MHRFSTNTAALLCALVALGGCATHKERLLPHGEATILDIWDRQTGGSAGGDRSSRSLLDARRALRRPLTVADVTTTQAANASYTRSAASEIYRQFPRLPNPDLILYVFPHLAGTDPAPVPGYSTVFPFYRHVQYAMPGERTEDY
jgi:conjugative transfer region lipoprotein (TIGR03751 family)